jgi:hypothetical protein
VGDFGAKIYIFWLRKLKTQEIYQLKLRPLLYQAIGIPGFPSMVGHLQSVKITVRYICIITMYHLSSLLAKVVPSGLFLYPSFFSMD